MFKNYKNIILNDVLEENYNFEIEFKESFLLDLHELEKCFPQNREDLKKEISKLLKNVKTTLMENENDKNIINKKYKGKYFTNIKGDEYRIQFFYNRKQHKLVFEYFDKIFESEQITRDIDLLICTSQLIFVSQIYRNWVTKSSLLKTSLFFIIVNMILFIVVEIKQKNEKIIWVNEKSFDYYRKWIRRRSVSELSKFYYFISWINLWIFSSLLLSTKVSISKVNEGKFIISLLLFIYAIKYFIKMNRLKIRYIITMLVLLVFIGYLNKEIWSFVALIFVIINQLYSEDIIYLSNELSNRKRRKIEKYIASQKGKEKSIKLKFKINIVILFFYLFIMIFDTSRFIAPVLTHFLEKEINNCILNLLILAVERMVILAIIYLFFKMNFRVVVDFRSWLINKVQIIINNISEKQFNELN